MQHCSYSVKRLGATWGISGDVCHIYLLCSSIGTLTMFVQDCLIRIDYGDECDFATDLRTTCIFGKSFSFGEECIGLTYCHGIAYSYCIMKQV
jgi:hypothetical protein